MYTRGKYSTSNGLGRKIQEAWWNIYPCSVIIYQILENLVSVLQIFAH